MIVTAGAPPAECPAWRDHPVLVTGANGLLTSAVARRLADLGVALIGGCCGTGPEHIRAMRAALD